MRKSRAILLAGLAVAAVSGAAFAASRESHELNVVLPDGFIAHIAYQGNVAPKVSIDPAWPLNAVLGLSAGRAPFGIFDRMFAEMDRQAEAIARGVALPSGAIGAPSFASVASFGHLPAGTTNTTVISTSNGHTSCTRTTQVFADTPDKPPRVVSRVSGDCSAAAQPSVRVPQPGTSGIKPNAKSIDRT